MSRHKWRVRFGVYATMAGILSTLVTMATPTAAYAGRRVPCPADITEWKLISSGFPLATWEGHRYTLHSSTPTFLVSDAQFIDNGLDVVATYTIQSTRSETFTTTASVGVDANFLGFLKSNVSASIVQSRTTALGVSFSVPVPARTRVLAEYGLDAYQVNYAIEAWRTTTPGGLEPPQGIGLCEEWGYYPQSVTAPTLREGWRLRN